MHLFGPNRRGLLSLLCVYLVLLCQVLFLVLTGPTTGVEGAFEMACMDKCRKQLRCKKYLEAGTSTLDFVCEKQCKRKCYKKIKT
ncbi:hypothetical protein TYRP_002097 [Tyrophagus putrescentiae]|nr:hypothetical protein TYRP_002097 [Tyrophagus putrescentiae]